VFIENKYKKYYYNIINNSLNRNDEYDNQLHEKHHILPKSFGGSDGEDNIAILTFREHYICHLLLTKFTTGKYKAKMIFALHTFFYFEYNRNLKTNSYIYKKHKEYFMEACKNRIPHVKKDIYHFKNYETADEFVGTQNEFMNYSNLSAQQVTHLVKRCIDINHQYRHMKKWGIYIESHKIFSYEKQSKASTKCMSTKKTCEHCGKIITIGNYSRWHGDKCKKINPELHYKNTRQVASINKKL
jgi:hypothetical protein